jgi:hypothetical protein
LASILMKDIIIIGALVSSVWLRRYATSRKVAGSTPDEVIFFFFNLPNPSGRTRPWGFTQPLTEMNTRNIKTIMFLGSKVRRVRMADNGYAWQFRKRLCDFVSYILMCAWKHQRNP